MSEGSKHRLVTRSDFDGLVCAVLLRHLDLIDDIKFVHPKDMQDGVVEIGPNDITTNLPYVEGVHLAFDHHLSETVRVGHHDNHIIIPEAPSAARVVFDYYGGTERFPPAWAEMMAAVDQADSARYSLSDIINPGGWALLNYVMDARTGLGRFRDFRISNYQLMMNLIEYCRNHTIDDILTLPDVKERTDIYFGHQEHFKDQIRRCARVYRNLVVLDLRGEEVIYAGNRFMIYALYPDTNISIHVLWGVKKQNTVFAIGKSILNRTARTNVGELCLRYNGGGHANAGTCQIETPSAERVLAELIARINADG
ncbi:exopolyphosphatase [Magnetospirillum fulvum]|uniref:NanoRNase/pAp phosphatase, hydrolyzes c-di-AMP and oligoRNAs n=1 Tax=Magnetospirillum fulvum TaxID=1082 RepID=A0A1H6IGW6_MAGFU|nr:exopolyphosphatase [Magnetospirillum fulvum]SEH45717.1 nanoRNase/pAp phosphatase, hydrolyzes c-di-AMP and oligoRNAs [Magnetospirillum fulvum]